MESLGKFLLHLGVFGVWLFTLLPFEVFVIRDIAQLFNVEIITSMSKKVLFGLLLIKMLVWYRMPTKHDLEYERDMDFEDDIKWSLQKLFNVTLVILMCWGISYIVHAVFI